MPIKFERGFQGYGDVRRRLQSLIREYPTEVGRAAKEELKIEKKESQRRTPYKTGALHDSHEIIEPEVRAGKVFTGLTAGNEVTESYDVIVHEDLEMFHPVGQAKFLESTWLEAAPHLADRIARRVELKKIVDSA